MSVRIKFLSPLFPNYDVFLGWKPGLLFPSSSLCVSFFLMSLRTWLAAVISCCFCCVSSVTSVAREQERRQNRWWRGDSVEGPPPPKTEEQQRQRDGWGWQARWVSFYRNYSSSQWDGERWEKCGLQEYWEIKSRRNKKKNLKTEDLWFETLSTGSEKADKSGWYNHLQKKWRRFLLSFYKPMSQ